MAGARRRRDFFDDEEYILSTHKKKKRAGSANPFFDSEAQEEDADGEEDYEPDEGDGGFLDDAGEAAEAAELALSERRRLEECMNQGQQRRGGASHLENTIGNLERRFQTNEAQDMAEQDNGVEEFISGDEDEEYIDDEDGNVLMDMQRMVPGGGAWKLWKVRTLRPGVEREACVAILKKFASVSERSRHSFMVASAFASDSVKGSIYVEAPSQTAIRKHLGDVRLLLTGPTMVKRVPVKEMSDVFQMDARREEMPRPGEWVRFQRGQYAGDLGLVSEIDEGAGTVVVRLIPRIDLAYEQRYLRRQEGDVILPPPQRPPMKRLTMGDLQSYQIEVDRINYFTESIKFRNYLIEEATGFLLRTVKPNALIRGAAVRGTTEEYGRFLDAGVDLSELVGTKVICNVVATTDDAFMIGQCLTITDGDLSGLHGMVVGRDFGGELRVQTRDGNFVSVLPELCRKEFSQGDSVRVIAGPHQGDAGLVTKITNTLVHVLSTETHHQISVEISHLSIASNDAQSTAGLTRLEGYSVGDFVLLAGGSSAGVITKIFRTKRLEVLTKDGVQSVELSQLSGRHNIRAVKEQDANNQEFGVGSSIEVIDGPYNGYVGNVKYLWKETVFVNVPSAAATGGLVTVSCAAVKLQQQNGTTAPVAEGHQAVGLRPRGQIGFRTRYNIMGTAVKVISGEHKGKNGELRGIHGQDALVLITSHGGEVRVPRHAVQLLSESSEAAKFFRRGGFRGGRRGGRSREEEKTSFGNKSGMDFNDGFQQFARSERF